MLEGRVRDLEPDEVVRVLAETLEDGRSDRVAARRSELVDVEGKGSARRRRGEEVRVLRLLVEGEVRRPDDDGGVRPDLRRVHGERDRVGRRLGAALDGDLQAPVRRLEEEIGDAAALTDREEDPLTGGAEREDPVEPRLDEEVDERAEGVVVDLVSDGSERRDGRGQGPSKHSRTLRRAASKRVSSSRGTPAGCRAGGPRVVSESRRAASGRRHRDPSAG